VDRLWSVAVPRIVDFLERNRVRATLFVVTDHLKWPEVREALGYLAQQGHELASHTASHPYPFTGLGDADLRIEMESSKKVLEDTFGREVRGFRAPAYDIDARGLRTLESLGYEYDSSIMPTVLNPLIVLAARLKSGWRTRSPFHFAHMVAPLNPYYPREGGLVRSQAKPRPLIEVPISVLPYSRLPFYPTFLNATRMVGLGPMICAARRLSFFNFEMHTIDFVSSEDVEGVDCLAAHPGLSLNSDRKLAQYDRIISELGTTFSWVPLLSVASRFRDGGNR
jgi:hypothetical protein